MIKSPDSSIGQTVNKYLLAESCQGPWHRQGNELLIQTWFGNFLWWSAWLNQGIWIYCLLNFVFFILSFNTMLWNLTHTIKNDLYPFSLLVQFSNSHHTHSFPFLCISFKVIPRIFYVWVLSWVGVRFLIDYSGLLLA